MAASANGVREVAGPECAPIADFGAVLKRDTLVPGDGARLMPTRFTAWLRERVDTT